MSSVANAPVVGMTRAPGASATQVARAAVPAVATGCPTLGLRGSTLSVYSDIGFTHYWFARAL
jgi:hypothetical protein